MSLANISRATPDDDQDDHDGTPHTNEAPAAAATLLAAATLNAALPRGADNIIGNPVGRVVIVIVPSASQVAPTGPLLHGRNPEARIHVVIERKKSSLMDTDPMPYVASGQTVLAVTHDPELLRPALRAAADLVVTVGHPDAAMVRKVINAVTGGRARGLSDTDIVGRDAEQIAAAIRPGSTAKECVGRLKRLQQPVGSIDSRGPDLETLPLFGEAKDWANDTVVDFQRLSRGEISPADLQHVLLYGPPGTGKTVLARAVAKSAKVRFFDTSVPAWFTGSDGHLDGVLKQAESFFQTLVDNAPAVGLLDELEAIPDRAYLDPRYREWWNSIITGVMLMISRVRESDRPILLIGATNYPDRIDAALKRPGRLGRHVQVRPAENETEVATLLAYYLAEDLDPASIAIAATFVGGATPAEIEGWVRGARRVARDAQRTLVLDDLLVQFAPADSRSPAELHSVAVHEAGHSVSALVLGHKLQRVSIVAEGIFGGITTWRPPSMVHTLRDIEDQVVVVLAGRAADRLLGAGADAGAALDLEWATMRLAAADASLGLREGLAHRSDDIGLRHLLRADPELLARVEGQLKAQMRRAEALVGVYADAIVAVAEALVVRRVLTGNEVSLIVAQAMRPEHEGFVDETGKAGRSDRDVEAEPDRRVPGHEA